LAKFVGGLQRSRREVVISGPSKPWIIGARSGVNVSAASKQNGPASHNSIARSKYGSTSEYAIGQPLLGIHALR
jgi:hypothetical protein